jgi:SAM-dependent methyltransferase
VRVPGGFLSPTEGNERAVLGLSRVEWDFADAAANRQSIHSFHSYPARFIPEIPRAFIRELPPPLGTAVFDPFCGCGTTLIEAQAAGYSSIGVDLNPIGCLISAVKTAPLPSDLKDDVELCLRRAQAARPTPLPDIPNLNHWFRLDVSEALAAIRAAICEVKDRKVRQALEVIFQVLLFAFQIKIVTRVMLLSQSPFPPWEYIMLSAKPGAFSLLSNLPRRDFPLIRPISPAFS